MKKFIVITVSFMIIFASMVLPSYAKSDSTPGAYAALKCNHAWGRWSAGSSGNLHYKDGTKLNLKGTVATCTKQGKEWRACDKCLAVQWKTTPKLGHSYAAKDTTGKSKISGKERLYEVRFVCYRCESSYKCYMPAYIADKLRKR